MQLVLVATCAAEGEDNYGSTVETDNGIEDELECAAEVDNSTSDDESDYFTDDDDDTHEPTIEKTRLIGARARLDEGKWMKMHRRLVACLQK